MQFDLNCLLHTVDEAIVCRLMALLHKRAHFIWPVTLFSQEHDYGLIENSLSSKTATDPYDLSKTAECATTSET